MLDTSIAVNGVTLLYNGQRYEMVKAGFANDIPYAEVTPRNDTVEKVIITHIQNCMPFSFSIPEIQSTLATTK